MVQFIPQVFYLETQSSHWQLWTVCIFFSQFNQLYMGESESATVYFGLTSLWYLYSYTRTQ